MDPVTVGARIAAKRREKGLTQRQLAEMVHVTDKAVSKWEQGKNFPELTTLESLSLALDCSPAELLGLEAKSTDEALLAGIELYEEERILWLKELRNRAWTTLLFQLLIFGGLLCISKYMDERAFYGCPMSLVGAMCGLSGTLIGYAIWTIRTGNIQLKRAIEKRTEANE